MKHKMVCRVLLMEKLNTPLDQKNMNSKWNSLLDKGED